MLEPCQVLLSLEEVCSAFVGGLMSCGELPLPLPLDLEAFKKLIASSGKRKGGTA